MKNILSQVWFVTDIGKLNKQTKFFLEDQSMKKLTVKKLSLSKLIKNQLSQEELKKVKGGQRKGCGCGCYPDDSNSGCASNMNS